MARKTLKYLSLMKDQIISSYQNDFTLRELAKIHGCSTGTIRNFLVSQNISMRSRGRKKGQKTVGGVPVNTAPAPLPITLKEAI